MHQADGALLRIDQKYRATIGYVYPEQDLWITCDQSIGVRTLHGRINRDNGDRIAVDLFGETNLPRAKAPARYFVKCVQSP